jgi:hypothetical protein
MIPNLNLITFLNVEIIEVDIFTVLDVGLLLSLESSSN